MLHLWPILTSVTVTNWFYILIIITLINNVLMSINI